MTRRRSIYEELTDELNLGKVRAIISSGQAVVLHRLAVMSKDGDWIVREDESDLLFILEVLSRRGAKYRLGAPLSCAWLAGGWSSHLEFTNNQPEHRNFRVRTDFVSRPPRLSEDDLAKLWEISKKSNSALLDLRRLAEIKKTMREKDYPIIGELALRFTSPREALLYARSAEQLKSLAAQHPVEVAELSSLRPEVLPFLNGKLEEIEQLLDKERRVLMRQDKERLQLYASAATEWAQKWKEIEDRISSLPLLEAHALMVAEATGVLPTSVS